jgi:RimJ/RimL family protein N-acetyltransferase
MKVGAVMALSLIAFLIIIPLHEFVHALLTPRMGFTHETLVGCWPARILFYAFYLGEISRERFLVVLIGPTVVLTVIPLTVIAVLQLDAPLLAAAALANGIGAAGDLLGLFVMGVQIPRGAIVKNKGWRSYWRRPALLITPRLILRPVEKRDIDALLALWRDADVRKYLWDDVVIERDSSRAVVEANLRDWRQRAYGLWTASMRDSGELAGFAGFRSSRDRSEPELLFGFLPKYWHSGLATEAAQTVTGWIFKSGHPAIWAATDPPNAASIRLMDRLGMKFTRAGVLQGRHALFYELRGDERRIDG